MILIMVIFKLFSGKAHLKEALILHEEALRVNRMCRELRKKDILQVINHYQWILPNLAISGSSSPQSWKISCKVWRCWWRRWFSRSTWASSNHASNSISTYAGISRLFSIQGSLQYFTRPTTMKGKNITNILDYHSDTLLSSLWVALF